VLSIGLWQFDPDQGVLKVENKEVHLTPRSASVLQYLLHRPGKLVTHDELLFEFWRGSLSSDNAVAKAVSEIRKALGASRKLIKTVPKRGYMVLVSEKSANPPVSTETHLLPPVVTFLPLINISADDETDVFTKGLTLEICNKLNQLAGVGFTIEMLDDISAIPKDSASRFVLQGAVRRFADQYVINIQMLNLKDNTQVWSERYSEKSNDIVAVQSRLSENIVGHTSSGLVVVRMQRWLQTDNPKAKFYFTKAFQEFTKNARGEGGALLHIAYLEKAVELDPDFFDAHIWLANTFTWRLTPIQAAITKSNATLATISRLIREKDINLKYIYYLFVGKVNHELELDYKRALALYKIGSAQNPTEGELIYRIANIDFREGRIDSALEKMKQLTTHFSMASAEIDWLHNYAMMLMADQQYKSALEVLEKALAKEARARPGLLLQQSRVYVALGNISEAERLFTLAIDAGESPQESAQFLAMLGRKDEAYEQLRKLKQKFASNSLDAVGVYIKPASLFWAYLFLEEDDETFYWLERSINDRDIWLLSAMRTHHLLEPLRSDPRFGQMLSLLESMETNTEEFRRSDDTGNNIVLLKHRSRNYQPK
jgi:DNA-binding winged helix-turn-helix (wHTH) protein